jgi:hypothetical protein
MCLRPHASRHAFPWPAPARALTRNTAWLCSVSRIVDNFALENNMAQEYKPGEIVPQSGIDTE